MDTADPDFPAAASSSEPAKPFSGGSVTPVPHHLRTLLAPARWIVQEWREYWYIDHEATRVEVGSRTVTPSPPGSGNYRIQFENQLGLAPIRAYNAAGQTIATYHLEVVAGKFGSADASVDFLQKTLSALFAQVASAPYVLDASTERLVREAPTPPNALFAFHFFRRHGQELIRAVQAILGRPYQRLDVDPQLVRPHEVRRIDRESMIRMLQAGRSAGPAPTGAGATLTPLQRLRPERVWQQIPVETHDTPENRFVLAVCRRMLATLKTMTRERWYVQDVSAASRTAIDEVGSALAMLTIDDRFAPLGPMVVTPVQSRVLQQKDGYRELAMLWQLFQRSREPIFTKMQAAIDLRSVDQLYELWVLFELITEIAQITGETPALASKANAFGVPGWGHSARFGDQGALIYNPWRKSYSHNTLRPDYLWLPTDGRPGVALDAKFRLVHTPAPAATPRELDVVDLPKQWSDTTSSGALMTMHAYRDAIPNIRAAVVLYPGSTTEFWDVTGQRQHVGLEALLREDWDGVGEIALAPHGAAIPDAVERTDAG